jgi:hypothetical protein
MHTVLVSGKLKAGHEFRSVATRSRTSLFSLTNAPYICTDGVFSPWAPQSAYKAAATMKCFIFGRGECLTLGVGRRRWDASCNEWKEKEGITYT